MDDELVLAVDENNVPIGGLPRSQVLEQGLWRRTAGGMVIDEGRRLVLCQRRSLTKDERPGLWVATFGGKARPDETPASTAIREVHEELGIVVGVDAVVFHGCIRAEERRQFEYIFVVKVDFATCSVRLHDGEAIDFEWRSFEAASNALQHDSQWYNYGFEIELLNSAP